jgi:hypothetical protein
MEDPVDIDLEAMRRRLDAATPGPWSHHGADVRGPGALIFTGRDGSAGLREQADRDAEFVANARADFAALLDLVQDLLSAEGAGGAATGSPTVSPSQPRHRKPQ